MNEPITHQILRELEARGFNLLESDSEWGDENPVYKPTFVENIGEYLISMELQGKLTGEEHILVIAEALTIPEAQLFGEVEVK